MEDSIAGLSLDDEEEEVIQLEVDEASKEISYANCLVGRFLTSSVGEDPIAVQLNWVEYWVLIYDFPLGFMAESVAQQLGNFIGEFCEYDTVAVQLGYKRIMRIRVRVDVRKPLKRKKRIALKNGESIYVRFEYEKLTLFCFLCGRLGYGESFYPVRVTQPQSENIFNWDISLRALLRRN
ncbi:hypothetical protein GOBAR_AA06064 [Gossypium barbadense]|uniref:Zinc knuckle CX2CX4HX4C domain-containing protein n=1 Tax=Gossypium barbadense TaxID=3634 RepID=A0A2P5YFY7_GOSBA|nr:hypothetical protein GOBAR_AA06064 [Gossypium barbadense]